MMVYWIFYILRLSTIICFYMIEGEFEILSIDKFSLFKVNVIRGG